MHSDDPGTNGGKRTQQDTRGIMIDLMCFRVIILMAKCCSKSVYVDLFLIFR